MCCRHALDGRRQVGLGDLLAALRVGGVRRCGVGALIAVVLRSVVAVLRRRRRHGVARVVVRGVRLVGRLLRALGPVRLVGPVRVFRILRVLGVLRRRRLVVAEQAIEQVLVQSRRVEGCTPTSVGESEFGGGADVLPGDVGAPLPCRVGHRSPRGHDVGTHPVDLEAGADRGDLVQRPVTQTHATQGLLGGRDPGGQIGLRHGIRGLEGDRILIEGEPPTDHIRTLRWVTAGLHLDGQAEAVEQLRAKLALLRVHGADQDDAGRVGHRHPVALDGVAAHGSGVEEQVDEMVVQEVDLVDIEQTTVRLGEQPRLESRFTVTEGLAEVEGADDAILGGTHREFDQASWAGRRCGVGVWPVGAVGGGRPWVAAEATSVDDRLAGQDLGQSAHHRGLRGALLAAHEHAADLGGDRGEDEGEGHLVGTDDGGEGVVGHDAPPGE